MKINIVNETPWGDNKGLTIIIDSESVQDNKEIWDCRNQFVDCYIWLDGYTNGTEYRSIVLYKTFSKGEN